MLVKDTGKEIEHFTDNGDVELSELPEGNYTFEINNSGYISKDFRVAISSRGAIQNFVTELTPQENGMEGIFKVLFLPCGSSLGGIRKVLVYMPSDYNKDKNKKYPVLYMNDGQEIYTQWGVDRTMEALIRDGKSKGGIIVGIYASSNRSYEYPPWECKIGGVKWGGLGEEYCNFVINGVKPYIDKNFRTLPERENTSIFGSSDGGISALYIGLKYSNLFSKIGSMSTSFEYKDREILKFIEENVPTANTKIYLDSGNEGYRITDMNDVYNKFIECGYSVKSVKKVYDPNGIHSPSSWGKRFPEAFLWLNEKE